MGDKKADIALIGLAVMGQNLVLNMNDKGYSVAVYNRTVSKVDDFINGAASGRDTIIGAQTIEELVDKLKLPRKIMLMVKAGDAVDKTIESILPYLDKNDIIIDGGNSFYQDTERRVKNLKDKGIRYIGSGVSGGELGARRGPSIMPGGEDSAWGEIKNIFQDISAKTKEGEACCDWVGHGGAGHFVKMVHNGIEYGDMQLIAEVYDIMKRGLALENCEMQKIFEEWNKTELDSYLIEITADILSYKEDGEYLVEKILDKTGQKGTGKWTGINSFELGVPLTLIAESVYARTLSSEKDERLKASEILSSEVEKINDDGSLQEDMRKALFAAKVISYAQGYMLMKKASEEFQWDLDYGAIALMWREGCIIRSAFLGKIKEAYTKNPELENLILDPYFSDIMKDFSKSLRRVVAKAALAGIPTPTLSAALSFYDGYRSADLPANLLQAQRDYFGAHTYQLKGDESGEWHHTNWTGEGGDAASTVYDA